MRLAALFWFYKEPGLCAQNLRLLRDWNPELPIFGLYGGDPADAPTFAQAFGDDLDDFFVAGTREDEAWKWRNGDLIIAEWFREQGYQLEWDTIAVVQWDTLIIGPIMEAFSELRRDEVLLSGLRPVDEVLDWWPWASPRFPEAHARYREFRDHVRTEYGFNGAPLCCLFITACLSRSFLARYAAIRRPELGFLEYRLPTYAAIFGARFCRNHRLDPWWAANPETKNAPADQRILNAVGEEISTSTVAAHLQRPAGARVFHPYRETFPVEAARRRPSH
jgi:hypothetical protein